MSSQTPQGNQPLQPEAIMSSPSAAQETAHSQAEQDASDNQKLAAEQKAADNQELTDDGRRSIWQLDHPAKSGHDTAKTGDPVTVEDVLLRLKKFRLLEYNQPVYIALMANPNIHAIDKSALPLMDMIREFLAGDGQVMLILGDSGAGKSTFNRHLEYQLWTNYEVGGRIPLFINLPSLDRPEKDLVAEQLRTYNFLEDHIRELKLHHQFMLICDGYDESQLTSNLHTTNLFNRPGEWDVKLLITCRTQYLGPDYRDRFAPKTTGQYHRTAYNLFQEAVIAPFSKEQIELYIENFVPLIPWTWVKKDYMEKLATIPDLMGLVRNPFILTFALETLPSVVEGRSDLSSLKITRTELYDRFVDHWLEVNKRRLQDQTLKGKRKAFEDLLTEEFVHNGIAFQKKLAWAIFQEQDGRPVVEYSNKRDRSSWKADFFGFEPEGSLLRDASLLSRTGNQYRFIHRSVLEYFLSLNVFDPSSHNDHGTQPNPVPFNSQLNDAEGPLFKRNLVAEPSVIQFLCERVNKHPDFERRLLAIVEQSKVDATAAIAATNAITILIRAGVSFSGADLRGVRIPGADLSGGEFDSAQFQGADLIDVNLTKSWIRQTDFSKARMAGTVFGELAYLEEASRVECCAYSPNGKTFAVGLEGKDIGIYNTFTWTKVDTFNGHEGAVTSLAFSPDGCQLLSGSRDEAVRIWNMETGLVDFVLEGHTKEIRAVAFSPSGIQVASAGNDMSVRLWEARTGTIIFVLHGHVGVVTSVAYSADGQSIASGGENGKIQIFDTQTGISGLILESCAKDVYCLAYSPDGQQIVSGYVGGELQLWKAVTGEPGLRWTGHAGIVSGVDFSPDGRFFASSGKDCTVRLWDAQHGTLVSDFFGHLGEVGSIAFSPNGLQLASSSEDILRLWDVQSHPFTSAVSPRRRCLQIGSYKYQMEAMDKIRRKWLVSGSFDMTARVWDVETGELRLICSGHSNGISSVAVSPTENRFATGSKDGTVRLWNAFSGKSDEPLRGHVNCVSCVTFSPNGSQVASGSHDGTVRLWYTKTGVLLLTLPSQGYFICSVAFSPDGKCIGSASEDETIYLWDAMSGELILTFSDHEGSINCIAFSPHDQQLASVGDDSTVKLWDTSSGASVSVLRGHPEVVTSVAYSSTDSSLVSGSWDETIRVWDLKRGVVKSVFIGHTGAISSVAFSPCGSQIASGSWDGTVKLWDPDSNMPDHVLRGHTGRVTSVAYSNDGGGEAGVVGGGVVTRRDDELTGTDTELVPTTQHIATIHDDNTIQLWDFASGASGAVLSGHIAIITSIALSPDGQHLVSSSNDGTVRLWTVPGGACLHTSSFLESGSFITDVQFSLSGEQVLTRVSDGTLRLWDPKTGEGGAVIRGDQGFSTAPIFSPNGQIVTANNNLIIHFWDASGTQGMALQGHTDRISGLAFSTARDLLVSASEDKTVRLWSLSTGDPLIVLTCDTDKMTIVTFSPNGQYVASTSAERTVRIWDCASGENLHILVGHSNYVRCIVYSSCNRYIATGSDDRIMRLWDAATGQCLAVVDGFIAGVLSVTWIENRLELYTVDANKLVHVWRLVERDDGGIQVQLIWRSKSGGLWMSGAKFSGVNDLSIVNRNLLRQRRAFLE